MVDSKWEHTNLLTAHRWPPVSALPWHVSLFEAGQLVLLSVSFPPTASSLRSSVQAVLWSRQSRLPPKTLFVMIPSLSFACMPSPSFFSFCGENENCLLKISLRSCEDPLCDKQLVPIEFTPYASRSLFIEMDAADTFLISCLISSRPSGFRDVPSLINRWKMRR